MVTRQIVISEQHEKISLGESIMFKKIQVLNLRFDNPYTAKHTMQISLGNGLNKSEMILSNGSIISYFYSFPIIDSTITTSQHHDSRIIQFLEPMGKCLNHFDINLFLDGVPITTGALTDSKKIYLELYFE